MKAEKLARELDDPERIAFVQCNTVETELAAGRPEAARARMQDGLAQLAKLSNPSYSREAECGAAQARLLWAEGNLPGAIDAAGRIAAMLEQRNQTDDLLYQTLSSMLDVMLSLEGRRNEAREWNRKLIETLQRLEGDTTISMSTARHNQAGHLYDAGEVRAAFDVERKLVEAIVRQQGMDTLTAAYAHKLGLYQVVVEESDAGFSWLDHAVDSAGASGEIRSQIGALLSRARASLVLRRDQRVLEDLAAAEKLARGHPGENAAPLRSVKLIHAELLEAQGDFRGSLAQVEAILAEIGFPKVRVANQLASMLTLKARAELALGRTDAALATARDAVSIARDNAPNADRSAHVGAALMALAQVQRANGDREAAQATARTAAAAFGGGLGPQHSLTRAAAAFD
jgi:tetratricopeptide (TPR) repeat protein